MARKTSKGPCDPCKGLLVDGAANQLDAHTSLSLEWRRDAVAIYHCVACDSTLTHYAREPNPWRIGVGPKPQK